MLASATVGIIDSKTTMEVFGYTGNTLVDLNRVVNYENESDNQSFRLFLCKSGKIHCFQLLYVNIWKFFNRLQ